MTRPSLTILVVIILAGCTNTTSDSSTTSLPEARTYYESLDLGSPEAAVRTMADAFARDDYMTVWMALHPSSQSQFQQHFNLMSYDALFDTSAFDPSTEMADLALGVAEMQDAWWFFDLMMMRAAAHDGLLIDLRGSVEITGSRPGPEGTTDVVATVDGYQRDLIFRVDERGERYKVLQVIVPGGNEEILPWSA